MIDLSERVEKAATQTRALPVMLLLDVSSSMAGDKIAKLNFAVKEMISKFVSLSKGDCTISVMVITFGGSFEANIHLPFTPVENVALEPLVAHGNTPLVKALELAKSVIEDKKQVLGGGYRPAVVLLSDGKPTDEHGHKSDVNWVSAMDSFVHGERTAKCDRFSIAVGADADRGMLKKFVSGSADETVLEADDANEIVEMFRYVTMSISMRFTSQNPDVIRRPGRADEPGGTNHPGEPYGVHKNLSFPTSQTVDWDEF